MLTGCGSRKSCCSRPGLQRCWSIIVFFWRRFRRLRRWPWPEERVLALWSGLGYYRRARMLHRAAKVVVERAGRGDSARGRELAKAAGSRALHGCGDRQHCLRRAGRGGGRKRGAGAEPHGRASRAPMPSAWKRAQELLDRRHPGDWNQAMMELGATVCTPQSPQCLVCPVLAGAALRERRRASRRRRASECG